VTLTASSLLWFFAVLYGVKMLAAIFHTSRSEAKRPRIVEYNQFDDVVRTVCFALIVGALIRALNS